jgi:hypothetical protein
MNFEFSAICPPRSVFPYFLYPSMLMNAVACFAGDVILMFLILCFGYMSWPIGWKQLMKANSGLLSLYISFTQSAVAPNLHWQLETVCRPKVNEVPLLCELVSYLTITVQLQTCTTKVTRRYFCHEIGCALCYSSHGTVLQHVLG